MSPLINVLTPLGMILPPVAQAPAPEPNYLRDVNGNIITDADGNAIVVP